MKLAKTQFRKCYLIVAPHTYNVNILFLSKRFSSKLFPLIIYFEKEEEKDRGWELGRGEKDREKKKEIMPSSLL